MSDPIDDFLAHYGVVGMKWGVRKRTASFDLISNTTGARKTIRYNPKKLQVAPDHRTFKGTPREARNVQRQIDKAGAQIKRNDSSSADHTDAKALAKKPLSTLSNDELKKLNARMQLEQTYSQLMTKQGSKIGKGQSHVKSALSVAKTMTEVYNVVNSPAAKAARSLIGSLK